MADAESILSHLRTVETERRHRMASPDLAARVHALKAFQQHRFAHSYRDLLQSPRYARAARFFLEELYGPADFSHRDAQFARVVPALVRLFPQDIVDTVDTLAQLHALSEVLDSVMAGHLSDSRLDAIAYADAWRATGHSDDRERQVRLTLAVGSTLERLTRNPLLRHSLRMMRGPAKAAGLAELQRFLEDGFDTFKAMQGAGEFLSTIGKRERTLAATLFRADGVENAEALRNLLGELP
jgi:hypothetical protein